MKCPHCGTINEVLGAVENKPVQGRRKRQMHMYTVVSFPTGDLERPHFYHVAAEGPGKAMQMVPNSAFVFDGHISPLIPEVDALTL